MFRRLLLVAAVLVPLSVHAQNDSCQYALDNECDEAQFGGGDYCAPGTDSTDCSILSSGAWDNSCEHAHDNECDEPRYWGGTGACIDGTDTSDCANALTPAEHQEALFSALSSELRTQLGDDSCPYANDNECDDEAFGGTGACAAGTDASDCRAWRSAVTTVASMRGTTNVMNRGSGAVTARRPATALTANW